MTQTNNQKAVARRNGRSLGTSLMTVSAKTLHRVCRDKGITFAEAENAVKVRQWLPFAEDAKEPIIDAEALWRRIGKPYKRFRDWANQNIKPVLEDGVKQGAEISATYKTVQGGIKKGYLLSRDMAAKFAMQAKTKEGNSVREYFLLMERIATSMAVFAFARAEKLVECDKLLTSTLHSMAPNGLDKFSHKRWVSDNEIFFKSKLSEVLSGARAGQWREILGSNNGIRDVLTVQDLAIYGDAYFAALTLLEALGSTEKAMKAIQKRYGSRINADRYLLTIEEQKAA